MVRTYLDISTLDPRHATGIGVYTTELLRRLAARSDVELVPVARLSRSRAARAVRDTLGIGCRALLPLVPLRSDDAVFHGPDFRIAVRRSALPKVVTVHDMVVFEQDYVPAAFAAKRIADVTATLVRDDLAAVIAISEFTRQQVLRYFPHLGDRVCVVHLGSDRFAEADPVSGWFDLPQRYVLFVGTLERRKNIRGIVSAFEIAKRRGRREKLLLVGGWGYGAEEIRAVLAASPAKADIVHMGFVPDRWLPLLYARASALIYPSWYEGFGLPVLEAMRFGCPVVASSCGALPEICSDAAEYADPSDAEAIADALCRVLDDDDRRHRLIAAGRRRAALFSWDECVERTVEVYRCVATGSAASDDAPGRSA
jgi:glycosyltransferase involved in cell wall biosynthesis